MIPVIGTQKLGIAGKKMRKFPRVRHGEGACCYNRRNSDPGAVSGISKWEIPDYTEGSREDFSVFSSE